MKRLIVEKPVVMNDRPLSSAFAKLMADAMQKSPEQAAKLLDTQLIDHATTDTT